MEGTRAKLAKLEKKVFKILSLSIKRAQVFIITNSVEGWVQQSCKMYMPKVEPLLSKVTIISARSQYEKQYPTNWQEWKIHAFLEMKKNMEYGAITNIITIGDSQVDLDAGHRLFDQFPMARLKTIKLKQCPTPDELDKELKALLMKLNMIIDSGVNMSIKLERKQNKKINAMELNSAYKRS